MADAELRGLERQALDGDEGAIRRLAQAMSRQGKRLDALCLLFGADLMVGSEREELTWNLVMLADQGEWAWGQRTSSGRVRVTVLKRGETWWAISAVGLLWSRVKAFTDRAAAQDEFDRERLRLQRDEEEERDYWDNELAYEGRYHMEG